jgi:nitrogen regulatory protein PII 1
MLQSKIPFCIHASLPAYKALPPDEVPYWKFGGKRRINVKMIKAIIRPEAADDVIEGLEEAGFFSLTKIDVFGRGKQKGITVGTIHYDELPKTLIMLVVEDKSVEEVAKLIKYKAYTGNYGDGKIFVTPVDDAYTIRTGVSGL